MLVWWTQCFTFPYFFQILQEFQTNILKISNYKFLPKENKICYRNIKYFSQLKRKHSITPYWIECSISPGNRVRYDLPTLIVLTSALDEIIILPST